MGFVKKLSDPLKAVDAVGDAFSDLMPDMPEAPPMPTLSSPTDLEAEAQAKAEEERRRLRKGRVQTVLTSGQGLSSDKDQARKTVLGG